MVVSGINMLKRMDSCIMTKNEKKMQPSGKFPLRILCLFLFIAGILIIGGIFQIHSYSSLDRIRGGVPDHGKAESRGESLLLQKTVADKV